MVMTRIRRSRSKSPSDLATDQFVLPLDAEADELVLPFDTEADQFVLPLVANVAATPRNADNSELGGLSRSRTERRQFVPAPVSKIRDVSVRAIGRGEDIAEDAPVRAHCYGDTEKEGVAAARAIAIVRYAPGSAFPLHGRTLAVRQVLARLRLPGFCV